MIEVKDATISVSKDILLKNISFIADDGKITCITGSEGSGKTVFLRTLMGFLPVTEGFVSVDGELLTVQSAPAFRKMMCYLPQNIHHLRHQLYQSQAPAAQPDEYGIWNIEMPSAEYVAAPKPLSSEEIFCMANKVFAEAAEKSIVIADEPTALLSPDLALQMQQLLQQLAEQGKCVLIASRNPQLIAKAYQVIDLNQFKI